MVSKRDLCKKLIVKLCLLPSSVLALGWWVVSIMNR